MAGEETADKLRKARPTSRQISLREYETFITGRARRTSGAALIHGSLLIGDKEFRFEESEAKKGRQGGRETVGQCFRNNGDPIRQAFTLGANILMRKRPFLKSACR